MTSFWGQFFLSNQDHLQIKVFKKTSYYLPTKEDGLESKFNTMHKKWIKPLKTYYLWNKNNFIPSYEVLAFKLSFL